MSGEPQRNLVRLIAHTLGTIVLGQGAQIVAGIATARAFGPAGKGIISYAGVFVMFGVAAAEGLRNAIAFQAGNQSLPLRDVWRRACTVLAVLAPAGSLVFLALWLHDRSGLAFLFVALTFPFAVFLQSVNVIYLLRNAIERINVQNAITVGAGSSLVTLAAVALFHANIVVVLGIWGAGYVAAALWAASGLKGLLRADCAARPVAIPWRDQCSFAIKGGLSAIVTLLAVRVDIIIVGAVLSKASLGVYATALALAELLYALGRAVTWATTARIAAAPRPEAVALTAKVVRLLLAVQTLAALVLFIVGPLAIDLLYGPRFAAAGLLLRIVLVRTVVYSVDGVLAYFIAIRAGRPGMQLAFELGTLVLCASLTSLAATRYGLTGAATAATLCFVLAFAFKLAYFVRIAGLRWSAVIAPRYDDLPERMRLGYRTA